jgi:RNA polymerase sigma factor (sigma-70 family)
VAEAATSESARSADLPFYLSQLHVAAGSPQCDDVWDQFVATYSEVVLHTCRAVAHDHDAAMDAYASTLEALREDNCRRLRAYVPEPNIKFSSWLVVVTRRLALDHFRQKYGRSRSQDIDWQQEHQTRKRLEHLLAEKIDPDQLIGESVNEADSEIRRQQLQAALARSVDQLSPSDRLLLVLRFEDERPAREIARILALPTVFHVYRRLGAVLSQLRSSLTNRGVDTAEP